MTPAPPWSSSNQVTTNGTLLVVDTVLPSSMRTRSADSVGGVTSYKMLSEPVARRLSEPSYHSTNTSWTPGSVLPPAAGSSSDHATLDAYGMDFQASPSFDRRTVAAPAYGVATVTSREFVAFAPPLIDTTNTISAARAPTGASVLPTTRAR